MHLSLPRRRAGWIICFFKNLDRKRLSLSLRPKRAWRVMDESTSDHTHPPSRQQAAVGGSRASSKATHAPSAKLWKQVNVHRILRPLLGPPRARSLHSTLLPYRGYVGGPDAPACTVSGCRELPSRRVFQPLHHCAQEKRWVTTNLGSAHLELGLS